LHASGSSSNPQTPQEEARASHLPDATLALATQQHLMLAQDHAFAMGLLGRHEAAQGLAPAPSGLL